MATMMKVLVLLVVIGGVLGGLVTGVGVTMAGAAAGGMVLAALHSCVTGAASGLNDRFSD